jgi:hypothetical protein
VAFILHSLLKKLDVEKIFPLLELCSILAKNPKAVLGPPAHPSLPPGVLNLLFLSLLPIAANGSDSLIRSDGSDLMSPLPCHCSVSRDCIFSTLAIFRGCYVEGISFEFVGFGCRWIYGSRERLEPLRSMNNEQHNPRAGIVVLNTVFPSFSRNFTIYTYVNTWVRKCIYSFFSFFSN